MEHEDNAHFDNLLQNSQNLMDNLQIASGGGVCGEVGGIMGTGEEIGVGCISGKFEEHVEHDDHGEWKYIQEVQQSEKQQQQTTMKVDDMGKNVYDNDGNEEGVGNGNSNGNGVAGEHEVDTATAAVAANNNANVNVDVVIDEEVEIIKNDGDFSTTSNTTSTVGEEEDIVESGAGDMLQVEMNIETQSEHHQDALHPFGSEELEEEDPSSLATNTTNGTSSLSENPPTQHQQQQEHEQEQISFDVHEDKENADPLTAANDNNSPTHPTDFDFELHSQLNPDAKEFVPSFGSSPTSPTNPNAAVTFESLVANVGEPANIEADAVATSPFFELQQPHPVVAAAGIVARHLIGTSGDDDDFVAQSPRKGRGSNMDAISLPAEIEFEHEVAKRPHELEQEDDLIAVSLRQQQQHSVEQIENGNVNVDNLLEINAAAATTTEDCLDFQSHAAPAAASVDHGPETSVDLDLEIDLQPDTIKQSLYMTNETDEEPIENILNTVQQLPIDFGDESAAAAGEKELHNVEEKEIVSHSPSTEEMQMNLQNDFHSSASARNIPQIPIDMDNAAHMQGSFYMEHTSADAQQQQDHELEQEDEQYALASTNESLLIDTTLPIGCNISDISFETVRTAPNFELQAEDATASTEIAAETAADPASLNLFATEFLPESKSNAAAFTNIDVTPSPLSTEEKHLMEDTKEQQLLADSAALTDGLNDVQQKMNELLFTHDGNLSQVEEVAQTATTIAENFNPFFLQENVEPEMKQQHEEEPQQHEEEPQQHEEEPQQHEEEPQQHEEEPQQHEEEQQQHEELPQQHEEEEPQQHEEVPHQHEHEQHLQPDVHQFEENYEHEKQQQQQNYKEFLLQQKEEIPYPIEEVPLQVRTPEVEAITQAFEEAFIEKSVAAEETTEAAHIAIEAAPIVGAAAAGAAIIGAVAATAAVSKTGATAAKKTESAKKPTAKIGASSTTATGKPKVSGDATKKAAGGTTSRTTTAAATTAARPRTAPAKTSAHATEKKTTTTASTATAAKPAPITRKPLTSSTTHATTAPRLTSSKPATARPTTAPTSIASKTSAAAKSIAPTPRTSTLTTARKTTTATTTNGTAGAAKPRLHTGTSGSGISAAPTKPTTLGITATAKPKLSPRATLTSQLRKASGPITTAKSPSKTIAPTTNGVTKSSTTTSSAGARTMKTTTTITTSTATKTFTARPAPKTTTTTTTARRTTLGTSPAAGTTGSNTNSKHTTTTTRTTLTARSPMSRPSSGRLSLSPTKASTLKSKSTSTTTKDITKKATPSKTTSANAALKGGKQPPQSKDTAVPKTNGTSAAVIVEGEQVGPPHLNGDGDGLNGVGAEQQLLLELGNGKHNGGGDARNDEFNLLLEQKKAEGALIDA